MEINTLLSLLAHSHVTLLYFRGGCHIKDKDLGSLPRRQVDINTFCSVLLNTVRYDVIIYQDNNKHTL